jgi:hypothetical protein
MCWVKVPTPWTIFDEQLGRRPVDRLQHLVDQHLGRRDDRPDHHRMLDEPHQELPKRAAGRAFGEGMLSLGLVGGKSHPGSRLQVDGEPRWQVSARMASPRHNRVRPLPVPINNLTGAAIAGAPNPARDPRGERLRSFSTRFGLLFAVMLVAASGNTAMQSLMPSIGRELRIPDLWMAGAFSLSAVAWVVAAPYWAKLADNRGRRALMRRGLYGFILSSLICGLVLAAGLAGLIAPLIVFVSFTIGRAIYGSGDRPPRPPSRPISRPARKASSAPTRWPPSPRPSGSAPSSARRWRRSSSSSRWA